MKTLITTLMMTTSITATAAEPIGAILTNEKNDTQIYAICASGPEFEDCEQIGEIQLVYKTTNSEKMSKLSVQPIEPVTKALFDNIKYSSSSVAGIIGSIGLLPAVVVIVPFAAIDELILGIKRMPGPATTLSQFPAVLVSAVPFGVFYYGIGLPAGYLYSKIVAKQAMSLHDKMLDPKLKGQVVTTRLIDNFMAQ